ncbi:MAG: acetylglutamate kinase [Anaerolineae bacterium]|nr:acetylglutamate kinase [Anaerolineae bacterium]
MQSVVVKVSGHELDDAQFLADFAQTIAAMTQPVIVVHGGGREISELQQKMGIEPRYADGLRITDAASLALVEMVLCGVVNTRLTRLLVNAGVEALGMSGVDRGLVRATQMQHPQQDMGFTGEVASVRGDVLRDLLANGVTPVIAPICLGSDSAYNVNADHVAGAVAAAVDAERVVFLTNVPGVLVDDAVVPTLTPSTCEALVKDGTIFGGMIPKVRTALSALDHGVTQAVITNLEGLRIGGGTVFQRT